VRFVVLVVGGVATGALSVGAVQTMVPQNGQMFQAVHALGSSVPSVKLTDINPLNAYDAVKRQITSGNIGNSLSLGGPSPAVPGTISLHKAENRHSMPPR
jgi:hypothetical protein